MSVTPGEVDPAAREVTARAFAECEASAASYDMCASCRALYDVTAERVLAALAAEGYSVVKLYQPESGRLSRPLLAWLSPLDDNNDRHLVWSTEAHAAGCDPLYRRVKGETT